MIFSSSVWKHGFIVFLLIAPLILAADASAQALTPDHLKTITYRSIGPTAQSGRFVDFAVPQQEPYVFYAATGSGGLWTTVNNGITFTPIFDFENVFSIGDIAVAPSSPAIIWVGTGEANNSRSTYWGDGVYKSVDGGKTWKNMGLKESHHIGRIVVHPTNPDVVYVAALGHLYTENPDRGIYKTTDGGKTWKKSMGVVVNKVNIGAVDVVMDPSNSEVLYAATYDRLRKPWNFQLGGPGSGIYKTTDGGANWKKLEKGLPSGILGRIGLAIYAKNSKILYAVVENANKPNISPEERMKEIVAGKPSARMIDGEIYRTDDAGETWRKLVPEKVIPERPGQDPAKMSLGGSPGYYYGQIIIDPNNDQHAYVLSVSVLETKDGGKTWNTRAFRFGGDNHALWINPKNSNHMLLGYDHGMGVTFDAGKSWLHPDNLPLAQFYAVDFDMSYPYRVAGGLQDNGSLMGPSTSRFGGPINFEEWYSVGGGDGMYNVFDRKTNRFLYNESQFGPLSRLDLVTGESKAIAYQEIKSDGRWNWNSPILVSAHDSDTIYHAGNILVKSINRGESWTEISPDLTTNNPAFLPQGKGGDGNIQFCTITTVDESPLEPGQLWVGTDDGNVWVTRDDGKGWTKCSDRITGNPGTWVSRVATSNFNPGTAYVSYTGLRNDDFRPFLYKTTDYGQTWTSLVGNLPNESINVVREDVKNPNLVFAGTDMAVFVSIDGGKVWSKMKGNMPTQPVHDLKIHPRENDLIVATHGRGIFIADISFLQELTPEVLAEDAHLFNVEPKAKWIRGLQPETSSMNYSAPSEPAGILINYYLKAKATGEVKIAVYKGHKLVNEIAGVNAPGFNQVSWDMMMRDRPLTDEEKKVAQQRMRRFAEFGGMGAQDPNYKWIPAGAGEYTVVLTVGTQQMSRTVSILEDVWFGK